LTESFKTDLVSRGIDPEKIDVVINGVNLSLYSKRPKSTSLLGELALEGKFVIGYIGTHGLAHALENVMYAAEKLRNHPEIHFLFVGPGAAREKLMRLKAELKLDNVTFVDSKPKNEIANYWSLCDVALVHLKNETTFEGVIPSKIFEAMGMGLPVLMASPPGEGPRILDETKSGFWVEPENPTALAAKALELAQSPGAVELAAKNSEAAAPKYSRREQAEKFIRTLKLAVSAQR
jgi:glycosyltransferase involved in cell wall biosynthesis